MTSQGEYSFEICSAGCCVLLEVLAYVRVQKREQRERQLQLYSGTRCL